MIKSRFLLQCVAATVALAVLPVAGHAQQKTAKACETEWRSNKAAIQGSGKTKKAFIVECRSGTGQTAAAPAPATTNSCHTTGTFAAIPGRATQGNPGSPRKTGAPRNRNRSRRICDRTRSQGALPRRYGRLGKHALEGLPLRGHALLRQHEEGSLYVRAGHRCRRHSLGQEREASPLAHCLVFENASSRTKRGDQAAAHRRGLEGRRNMRSRLIKGSALPCERPDGSQRGADRGERRAATASSSRRSNRRGRNTRTIRFSKSSCDACFSGCSVAGRQAAAV